MSLFNYYALYKVDTREGDEERPFSIHPTLEAAKDRAGLEDEEVRRPFGYSHHDGWDKEPDPRSPRTAYVYEYITDSDADMVDGRMQTVYRVGWEIRLMAEEDIL